MKAEVRSPLPSWAAHQGLEADRSSPDQVIRDDAVTTRSQMWATSEYLASALSSIDARLLGALGPDPWRRASLCRIEERWAPPGRPSKRVAYELLLESRPPGAPRYLGGIWGCRRPTLSGVLEQLSLGVETVCTDHERTSHARPLQQRVLAPVVLDAPLSAAFLHACVGHTVESDNFSSYGDRLKISVGEAWAGTSDLTVVDDPSGDWTASYDADDEGTSARRTVVVDHGRLASLLTTRSRVPGADGSTGNARRALGSEAVMPRLSVFYAQPGPASFDDLLQAATGGFYCSGPRGSFSVEEIIRIRVAWAQPIREGRIVRDETFGPIEIRARKDQILRRLTTVGAAVQMVDTCFLCAKEGALVPVTTGSSPLGFEAMHLYPVAVDTG